MSNFQLPDPIKVNALPAQQAEITEQMKLEERIQDNINHLKQIQQQPQNLPPPQQLPPAPQQLPQINYQQQVAYAQQQAAMMMPINAWTAGPPPNTWQQNFAHMQAPWQQPPMPQFIDPRESIDLKLIRKPKKKDKRCFTCKPRGKVKHHIINTSSSGNFTFHHDMHKRPVIIVTPNKHVEQIYELSPEEMIDFFKSIEEFTNLWKIKDYQITINAGRWQDSNHSHLHCKIRIAEKMANRMRRDHFEKIKLEKRYKEAEIIGPKPNAEGPAPVSKNKN